MPRKSNFSPEVRERAVRLVTETRQSHDSEWSAITSVAEKIGCTPETLRKWTRQSQREAGTRPGPTTEDLESLSRAAGHDGGMRLGRCRVRMASTSLASPILPE